MPRRKLLKIMAVELKINDSLIAELQKTPQFMNCDFSTLEIIALSKKAPPRITQEKLDKAIRNLERQIAFYGKNKLLNKKGLCKAIGISRPTLDNWCEAGFISSETDSNRRGDYEPFEPGIVLRQLIILRNKH
jgi:hypothetical protein